MEMEYETRITKLEQQVADLRHETDCRPGFSMDTGAFVILCAALVLIALIDKLDKFIDKFFEKSD